MKKREYKYSVNYDKKKHIEGTPCCVTIIFKQVKNEIIKSESAYSKFVLHLEY